jgi:hypothetical protein
MAAKSSRYNVASSDAKENTGMFAILELNLHGIGIMSECSSLYTFAVGI